MKALRGVNFVCFSMGFDLSLFEGKEEIDEDLICPICKGNTNSIPTNFVHLELIIIR